MSNEEIYRQIHALERQIAELRSQLPPVEDWKAPKLVSGKSLEEQEQGDPFRIHSEAEMELTNLPELARLILDALPLQVYIKRADTDNPRKARQYTYLNRAVRDLNGGWSRDEVKAKYDRDVFGPGQRGDELYRQMQIQETQTMDRRESRITRTVWNQPGGYWSRNENIEIPIWDQHGQSIGFCSLAQNLVFEEASRVLAIYQKNAQHRVYNLLTSVTGFHLTAIKKLNAYRNNNPPADALSDVVVLLDRIGYELNLYSCSSQFQIGALDSIGGAPEIGTVGSINEELRTAYKDCGFSLTYSQTDCDPNTGVIKPKTVKAILSVLIANAVGKHQPVPETGGVKQCNIDCSVSNGMAVWTVSNSCYADNEEYVVADKAPVSINEVMNQGFDKVMLTYFVLNSFPGKRPSEMIRTRKLECPQRFIAELIMEVAHDV